MSQLCSKNSSQRRWLNRRLLCFAFCAAWFSVAWFCAATFDARAFAAEPSRPNIVYVLCDDLGYGDVRCLNPEGKIATPQMDRLAAAGMVFTDMHSGSSVCTPTRYGVMTGRYAWRSRLKSGVLGGLSPRLIEPDRLTVASLLKQHGYHTQCIGKWHLGMDWVVREGKSVSELQIESSAQVSNVDYARPVTNGPLAVGFDGYFGIAASLDMVPYAFLQNDRVTELPSEMKGFPMMAGRPGLSRVGPWAPSFEAMDVLPTLTREAVKYVAARAADAKQGRPFFLYLPLNAPHTPILPSPEWQGKSGISPYADFVMQTDASIGQVMQALDEHGLAENTLFIVTSDNGCSPAADFSAQLAHGHNPSGKLRGHKADIFDGGHRIPFLVRWPARVRAGAQSAQLGCLTDLMATCAAIVDAKLPGNAGEDSVDLLPALLGKAEAPLREAVVHHSINGSFAIRQGDWKLGLCPGSGGWSEPRPGKTDTSSLPAVQLYNLADDLGETKNVQGEHSDVVERLTNLLQQYVDRGRSTPGASQANTTPVEISKAGQDAHKPLAKKSTDKKSPAKNPADKKSPGKKT